jgi:CheY-like chemotaxis protein
VPTAGSILIVDDEFGLAEMLREMLRDYDYDVSVAINGRLALDILKERSIGLVITDMMMPVMDGPATIRALRALQPDVRIIASSGLHGRGNDPYSASIASVRHFLSKPYTAETLLTALRRVLTSD